MEQFGLALILFAAFWVGCAAGYIAMRLRAQVAYEKGRSESAAEISQMSERLTQREQQYNDNRDKADAATASLQRLETELRAEVDRRTVAEARLSLLPKYEAELESRAAKIADQQKELTRLHGAVSELGARLEGAQKAAEEKVAALQGMQAKMAESFQAMSAETTEKNNQAFLEMANKALAQMQERTPASATPNCEEPDAAIGEMVEPLRASLERVDARIGELERERVGALAALAEQVESIVRTQASLQAETAHLAQSLRVPAARGGWGEVQLRRVVEAAGMLDHCDFAPVAEEGIRPDMVVRLPGQRQIVVDSRVALTAYQAALAASDDSERIVRLKDHASTVRAHIETLGGKNHWDQLPQSPEFVIAFLPGEAFFCAAMEEDPSLLEFGVERRVILATPSTLIALLKAIAWGWKQEKVSANAKEIRDLGKGLYDRLRTLADHFVEMQRGLARTTAAFNRTVGSFETQVVPSARRFRELGAGSGDELTPPPPVDSTPRSLNLLAEAAGDEAVKISEEAAVPAA